MVWNPHTLLRAAAPGVLFLVLASIDVGLTRQTGGISAMWSGNAAAAAMLALSPVGLWAWQLLGVALANLAVNLTHGDALTLAALLVTANLAEIMVATLVLRRLDGGRRILKDGGAFITFLGGVVLLPALVGTLIGTSVLHTLRGVELGAGWRTWFPADALGLLSMTPAIVAVVDAWSHNPPSWRAIVRRSPGALMAFAIAGIVFSSDRLPYPFVLYPAVLAVPFIGGLYVTVIALAGVSAIAIAGTVLGHGPMGASYSDPSMAIQLAQLYLAFLNVTTLAVAVKLEERQRLLAAHRATDAELRRTNRFLQSVLAAAPFGIVAGDGSGGVRIFNRAAERMFGWPAEEILGRRELPDFHKPGYLTELAREVSREFGREIQPGVEAMIARALAHGRDDMQVDLVRRDGSEFTGHVTITAVLDEDGKTLAFHTMVEDVTQRLEQEKQRAELIENLQAARAQADDANLAKSEFLAAMSHEIRTPLNGLIGFSELMLNTPLTPEQRQYATLQREAGQSLLALVNDILDHSRIEAGKLEIDRHSFDLQGLLRDTLELVSHTAAEKSLVSRLSVAPDLPAHVLGDALRIRQVLLNLLTNAVKFTHRGGVTLSVARAAGGGERLRFAVTDTGIGIAAEKIPLLFQRFSQADRSTTRRYGGSGLGLAISKRLVDLMGGTIGVEASPGSGATFWFELALPPAQPKAQEVPPHPAARPAPVGRILVVEDVEMNRVLVNALLRRSGHTVEMAENGAIGVEMASHGGFDLILMDIQMPVMDGLDAARAIRALPGPAGRVRIMALTAAAVAGEVEVCLQAGMNDHLTKPFDSAKLLQKVAGWIGISVAPAAVPPPPAVGDLVDEVKLADRDEAVGADQMARLIDNLDAEVTSRVETIRTTQDLAAIRRETHALVSLTGNFAMSAAYTASVALSEAARAGDIAACASQIEILTTAALGGVAELRRRYRQTPALQQAS